MWRENILAFGAVAFISGTVLSGLYMQSAFPDTDLILTASCLVYGLLTCSVSAIFIPKIKIHAVMAAFFFSGASGAMAASLRYPAPEESVFASGKPVAVKGKILECGLTESGKGFLKLSAGKERTVVYGIPGVEGFNAGDSIRAVLLPRRIENYDTRFDYAAYMGVRGYYYTCTPAGSIWTKEVRHPGIACRAAKLRKAFSEKIDSIYGKGEVAGMVKALIYGEMEGISEGTAESFRASGAMHLLAISGMHIAILYRILSAILSVIGNFRGIRPLKSVLIIVFLWGFSIFTGLGVSILRAVVMATIYETGNILGRRKHGINSLSISALIIGTVDPAAVCGAGFQLSYSAMAAIFIIYPRIAGLPHGSGAMRDRLWKSIALTISCHIATAPVAMAHFGTFAHFSVIANILSSPLSGAALPLSILPFLPGFRHERVSGLIADAVTVIIKAMIYINRTLSSI